MYGDVKVWREAVSLPTWTTGKEDPNPMFLEKRVYQGSSGAVYPYGVIDTLTGVREDKTYQAVFLENDFIQVMLLPELGGRIHRAWDKVMQRDFVYYNEVVKPALVGLVGPWISGGIEFNWPQHHRPTTFMPVDVTIGANEDGSQTVWLGELEPMRGLQVMTGFTLYPHKALIEITGKIFNPNATPRHFLWWANPAVKGGDDHQSVFPPDVTAVFDHGKRDVSSFPIAHGTYYKVDYSAGVDISRYKNIPVPTSYMADKSDYDFVGAWHHGENGGLLHVADHHVSPGKKQWSWGYGDFGQAWDRNLTDANGPYIELMTGVFTDNQPDFTWIAPFEEKVFVQNFLPYSHLGTLQNASTEAAIKLERHNGQLHIGVYAVSPLTNVTLELTHHGERVWQQPLTLTPTQTFQETLTDTFPERLALTLRDAGGQPLLHYLEHIAEATPLPSPACAPALPADIANVDELWFIGQHLEQYQHASRNAFDYYRRALEIDPLDYRCNVALGRLEFNRANWAQAQAYAEAALKRAHRLNKNPQCGQASQLLGAALERQGQLDAAYDHYFKASWSGNCRDAAFYDIARLALRRGESACAQTFCQQSLRANASNHLAMALYALLMAQNGQRDAALTYIDKQLRDYPLSYPLYYARYATSKSEQALTRLRDITNQRGVNASVLSGWLVSLGMHAQARDLLAQLDNPETLPLLWRAALAEDATQRQTWLAQAKANFPKHVRFPNLVDEVDMLRQLADDGFAQYLLGCFYYSKRRYSDAVDCWAFTRQCLPDFAPVHRLLGIWAWNKQHDAAQAEAALRKAVELEPQNPRLLFERDYLYKQLGRPTAQRLALLEKNQSVALMRDDLTAELLSLWHIHDQNAKAHAVLSQRTFHPWEGGEGKVTGQYLINQQRRALEAINQGDYLTAQTLLTAALHYPRNLGEGRLAGQTDNDIWYLLGWCAEQQQETQPAQAAWRQATQGDKALDAGRYYNDQPVDYQFWQAMALKRLGEHDKADARFRQFIAWGQQHQDDPVESDFFAVSLPDLVVLDSDPQAHHRQHCLLLQALGYLGLGERHAFNDHLDALLTLNPAHDKAHLLRALSRSPILR